VANIFGKKTNIAKKYFPHYMRHHVNKFIKKLNITGISLFYPPHYTMVNYLYTI